MDTLSIKVADDVHARLRAFADAHCISIRRALEIVCFGADPAPTTCITCGGQLPPQGPGKGRFHELCSDECRERRARELHSRRRRHSTEVTR